MTEISAPPLIVVGARHALERGAGRATVPQRTALAVGALGAALAVAALVFTSGLDRLVTDPTSYGVTWQMHIDINYDPQRDSVEEGRCTSPDGTCGDYQSVLRDRMAFVRQVLSDSPDIVAATPYSQEILELDGTTIGVYAMGDGPVQPTITAGRRPGDDEIALGRAVMTDLGVHIGDTVTTSDGLELSVVGVALVPDGLPGEALGHGGVVTSQTAQRIDDRDVPRGFLMRTSAGADTEALLAQLRSLVQSEAIDVEGTPRPAQIGDYRRIRSTPIVLALSLAAIGAGMLIVGVMSAVRRRRHEYALLQALGASPNQIVVAIQTQALVSYGVVLVFGLAIGVIGGGVAWNAFEHRLGTQSGVQWPLVTLLVAALVAGGLTVLLMQPVARRRAVQRPAGELRIE